MAEREDKYCLDRCDLGDVFVNRIMSQAELIDRVLDDLPAEASVLDAGQ